MKLNAILSILAPRDQQFYPLLAEAAGIVEKSATLLHDLFVSTDREEVKEVCKAIKAEESEGDKMTRKIFKALNKTFITPFDREDISKLTDDMDDVTDLICRVAQKVMLFAPETLPPATIEMAAVIKKGGAEIRAAVAELARVKKSDQKIRAHTKEIKRLEEEADGIYESGMSNLFKDEMPLVELIKLKEIIKELEKVANKMNTVSKVLKTIVVKYA